MKHLLILLLFSVSITLFANTWGDYEYIDNGDNVTITNYTGSDGDILIPSEINGKSVVSINAWTFYRCESLTSVIIPNSVTSIGEEAFYHCSSLTSAIIPNSVTSIEKGTFEYCESLASITIPNSVTNIEKEAFRYCDSLTSVTIPNSVTSIGDSAFFNYSYNLKTAIFSGDAPTTFGSDVFRDFSEFTIYYHAGATGFTTPDWEEYSCEEIPAGQYLLQVNEGSGSGFYSSGASVPITMDTESNYFLKWTGDVANVADINSPETTITMPAGTTMITANFLSCGSSGTITGYTGIGGYLTIPSEINGNPVVSIGDSAFYYCDNVTSVIIPNSVTTIGDSAFCYCDSLESITIPDSVTSIGDSAFRYCESLESITIPNSVTTIGDEVFRHCKSLASITVDATNSDYSSVDGVLFNKNQTTLIQYPSGKSGTSYTVPGSVTTIAPDAFYDCDNLASVIIPESVTSIEDRAFYDCNSLSSVIIGNNVTNIAPAAFYYCDSLASVTIPESVTNIGSYAFRVCTNLTSAVFSGNAPTALGNDMFVYADEFTTYYHAGATGFTTPIWEGYPCEEIPAGQYFLQVNKGSASGLYDSGAIVSITADAPSQNYYFENWTTNGGGSFADANSSATTYTMPGNDAIITANFAIDTYTLTYTAGAHGSIAGTTPQSVNHGDDGTEVTAVPDAGYHFVNWSDASTANPRKDTNITYDLNVTANFASGTVTPSKTTFDVEEDVVVNFANGPGNATDWIGIYNLGAPDFSFIDRLYVNGTQSATTGITDGSVTFSGYPEGNYEVRFFENNSYSLIAENTFVVLRSTYTLTVNNGTGSGNYEEATVVDISATAPPEGEHFVNWTGDVANVADVNMANTTITMPASAATITANFAINHYSVTFVEGTHGSRTGGGDLIQTVDHGSAATAPIITPNAGWVFDGWDVAFDNVVHNLTVTAQYTTDGNEHLADNNPANWTISQTEVNAFIAAYANNNNTAGEGNGDITAGRITLQEVLRVIYLYNNGGTYKGNQATVDTYDIDEAAVSAIAPPPAEELPTGNVITVANSADSGLNSLRNAITFAADGDTITFDKSIETITLINEILIDKSITIDGSGVAIVSGNSKTRIFQVYNENEDISVLLLNMGIVDANNLSNEFGGAIYNNGENLTLENCLFDTNKNSFESGKGGAIYSSGSLTVNNCEFSDNSASEENDIYSTNGKVVIE